MTSSIKSPQHSAEPATHQALAPSAPIWFSPKLMCVMDLLILSASAKAWRQRQVKVGVLFEGPSVKTRFLKCSKKGHSTETCRICLIQNIQKLKKQSPFSIYIFADNSTRSEMNDETTEPPNFKLVTVTGCPGHDIFHQIAAAFSGAHHTPGLGALVANLANLVST